MPEQISKEAAFDMLVELVAEAVLRRKAAKVAKYFEAPNCRQKDLVEIIVSAVARFYDIPAVLMMGPRGSREVTWARQVGYYFLRHHTTLSHKEIAAVFLREDHGSSHHGLKKVQGIVNSPHLPEYAALKQLGHEIQRLVDKHCQKKK